ncbi:MAG: hypothetical protein ACP5OU_05445 [Methanothrix sp.]
MKNAAMAAIVVLCLLTAMCGSQEDSHFQSLSGDYGRKLISSIDANDTEPVEDGSNGTLWSWGSSPRGSMIVDGNLVGDPAYTMKRLNVVSNWLGDSLVDPYDTTSPEYSYTDPETGQPVKTYADPITGQHYYTYTDAKSGKLIYVYFNPLTGVPYYASFTPISGQQIENKTENQTFSLPPIFS